MLRLHILGYFCNDLAIDVAGRKKQFLLIWNIEMNDTYVLSLEW